MQSSTTLLKISGFSSLEKLRDDFASYMVDVGYIAEEGDGYVLVAPDDPRGVQLQLPKDYEWFAGVVAVSLRQAGEQNIIVAPYSPNPSFKRTPDGVA
ncbi:hypothetical protein SNE35_24820 [Paucibacter sp. R3-3]|uniref:Uncharacterized protein n=1 Tax=Roseateles agri TaxID=3098619 RepID=A0ABU5DQ42_9BURK|nr:hypothetical protein [Paucibacter sp. R3-3]MDY0747750.1 hypothetical protein [Paucibacter sp. R3-3]